MHVSRGGQAATRAADLPTSITAQVRDEIARLADGMPAPFSVWLVLIYFGPTPPAGKEHNWVQTIPGKGWYTGLRLYGPLEPWFDKT